MLAMNLAAHLTHSTQSEVAVQRCWLKHVLLFEKIVQHTVDGHIFSIHHGALPALHHMLGCVHAVLQCRHSRLVDRAVGHPSQASALQQQAQGAAQAPKWSLHRPATAKEIRSASHNPHLSLRGTSQPKVAFARATVAEWARLEPALLLHSPL